MASHRIRSHVEWGERSDRNVAEQGGLLLGHAFIDEKEDLLYGIVEDAVPASSGVGTATSLELNHRTWRDMAEEVDSMIEQRGQDLQIIGWYHTHPGHLDVFMSKTDRATQEKFFADDWQFAIVLNPHKKEWRVFHGRDAQECPGFVFEG